MSVYGINNTTKQVTRAAFGAVDEVLRPTARLASKPVQEIGNKERLERSIELERVKVGGEIKGDAVVVHFSQTVQSKVDQFVDGVRQLLSEEAAPARELDQMGDLGRVPSLARLLQAFVDNMQADDQS